MTKRYHHVIWICPCGETNWNKCYGDLAKARYPCDICGAFCRMSSGKIVKVTGNFNKAKEAFRNGTA